MRGWGARLPAVDVCPSKAPADISAHTHQAFRSCVWSSFPFADRPGNEHAKGEHKASKLDDDESWVLRTAFLITPTTPGTACGRSTHTKCTQTRTHTHTSRPVALHGRPHRTRRWCDSEPAQSAWPLGEGGLTMNKHGDSIIVQRGVVLARSMGLLARTRHALWLRPRSPRSK